MAKFRSFASQGSFSANQIQLPDEARKIQQAAESKIRGMEQAQAFLEKNRELYLRTQQQVNALEADQRKSNFQLETENRKLFQEAKKKDHETYMANEAARTKDTEQFYQDLSAFSKTAFDVYSSFEQQRKKQRQAFATQEVLQSGLGYDQLVQLTKIDQKLTDSAFRQTEFIQDLIDSGASEDRIRIIGKMWRANSPNLYLKTQAAYQNSFLSYVPGLNKAIGDLGPDASIEQIQSRIQSYQTEFLTNKFPGGRTEIMESSGVLRQMQSFNNQLISSQSRQAEAKRAEEVKIRFKDDLQTTFVKDGLAGVMRVFQTDPSSWKREEFTKWVTSSLKAGGPNGLTPEQGQDILNYNLTVGDQSITFSKQFGFESGEISAAARAARSRSMSEYNLSIAENKAQADAQLAKMVDSFTVDGDGRIDDYELERIEQQAALLNVPDSEVVRFAQMNSVSAQTDSAVRKMLTEKADNMNLTVEDVMGIKMGSKLRQEMLNIARQQEAYKQNPSFKSHVASIEAAISQHPQIKAAPITGSKNYSVLLMQERFKREYMANLQRTESPEEAFSLTMASIEKLQSTPGAINAQGRYTEIENQIKQSATSAQLSLKEFNDFLTAIQEPDFKTNPKKAVNAVGAANFYNSYDAIKAGKAPKQIITKGAELLGVSPLTFMNYLAKGAGQDPIEVNDTLMDLRKNAPLITRRLYDTYRTNERVSRANVISQGMLGSAPRRGAFSEVLGMIRSGEGNYTSANRGTAGDSPGGIPGLNSMTVGRWKQLQREGWFALGAYQFTPDTFEKAVKRLGLSDDTVMDESNQDLMAIELISGGVKRPTLAGYLKGANNNEEGAAAELALEWAAVAGSSGRSSYAGIGGNAASIGYEEAKAVLRRLRQRLNPNL